MEINEDRMVLGIEVKGLSPSFGMEDRERSRQARATVQRWAPWMLIRWAQTRREKEEKYGR